MPIEWSYDASSNITKLKLKEILNAELDNPSFNDIDYTVTLDYGDIEEPTIKN